MVYDGWYRDARRLLDNFGFVEHRNGWLTRADVYVFVDSEASMPNARFVGLYVMHLDDAGREMMHAIAMVPWYGDGPDQVIAFKLLTALLNQAIYGSDS